MPVVEAPPTGIDENGAQRCPVCGDGRPRSWGTVDDYPINRCRSCGHLYVAHAVSDELLAKSYEEGYYKEPTDHGAAASVGYEDYLRDSQTRFRGFNQRLSQLERFVSPPARVLDFGCAVGLFVRAAQDRGWQAVGYDRSEWAARYGRERLGVSIESGNLPRFDDGSFDLVTLWDSIEHLTDPRGVLVQIYRWLRPGGLLALNTVNSSSLGARLAGRSWRHVAPPFHLHLFSARSLKTLVGDVGFSIIRAQGEGVVLGAAKGSGNASVARAAFDNLVCHWRLRPITTALNLRDEQFLVARRIN